MLPDDFSIGRVRWFARLGMLFVLPATLVPLSETFHLSPSSILVHPVLVVGGLLAALALNVLTVLRIRFQPEPGALVGNVKVLARWPNLAVALISSAFAASLLAYGFLENFRIVAR